MILYPTETLYALGVNVLDDAEMAKLFQLKKRDERQAVSWLVRNMSDVERYAEVSELALEIANKFLPGQITLVLQAKNTVPITCLAIDKTLGFRISSDPLAEKIISDFMDKYDAPLSCTSANVSGQSSLPTTKEILEQFGDSSGLINQIYDDGPRAGVASTVVRVIDDNLKVLREGVIKEAEIIKMINSDNY